MWYKSPRILEFLRFTYLGLFLRVVTFVVNLVCVEALHLSKDFSFFIVMTVDLIITFFISFYYVFKPRGYGQDRFNEFFIKTLVSGLILRTLNWWAYVWLIEVSSVHYLWIQFWSTSVVFFIKYIVFSLIFKN